MRISVLVALLGAAAMLPTAANAQDRHGRSDGGSHSESRGDRANGGGQRAAPARAERSASPSFQHQNYGQRPGYNPQSRPQTAGDRQPYARPQSVRGETRFDSNQRADYRRSGAGFDHDRDARTANYAQDRRGGRGDYQGQRGQQYRGNNHRGAYDRGRGGYDRDRGHYDGHQGYNRNWHGDRRYDWRDYRAHNRNAYRLPRYYAPYGWDRGYRRFSIGFRLSSVLFGENYWISDPYDYRLPPAYGPYRWVRYYNDALLVDVRTGSVVDTVYGIFW